MTIENPDLFSGNSLDGSSEILTNSELYESLKSIFRFTFVSGLPCGELRNFIAEASQDKEVFHLPASNEREATGIATGAWLAGKQPILYMQNSGLFLASNDIGSLILACKIPIPIIASWRGAPGETATQHFVTGSATEPLLNSFGIPYVSEANKAELEALGRQMRDLQTPVCVLKIRERYNDQPQIVRQSENDRELGLLLKEDKGSLSVNREEAINILLPRIGQDMAVISSTGLISRSIYQSFDAPNQFYNAGAFGLTSSIGLGLAIARPDIKVVVIEGDGSVLADIGNLNLIGCQKPKNLIHVVLNNAAYVSCSGEPTCQPDLIPNLACQFGYKEVYSVSSKQGIESAFGKIIDTDDLQMLHVDINTDGGRSFDRPTAMADIARRFQAHFSHE